MNSWIAIFIAALIHGALLAFWDMFKAYHAKRPTPMAMRNGVYVPWGPVEKMQRLFRGYVNLYIVWLILIFSALAYQTIIKPAFS